MLLKDIFKDIYKGVRIEKDKSYDSIDCYLIDTKDVDKCVINYTNSGIQTITMDISNNHILKEGDIIIATVPSSTTCHVGYCSSIEDNVKAVIKKNFIILRNPINDNYNLEFIAEYLENIGINDYINNIKKNKEALTKEDIRNINIPNIDRKDQDELISVIRPINERCILYNKLINNDSLIKKYMLEEVINNEK